MDCLTLSFIIPIYKMFNRAVRLEVLVQGSRVNKIWPPNRISSLGIQMNREVQRNPAWNYQKGNSWKDQWKSKAILFFFPFLARSDDCSLVKKMSDVTYFPKHIWWSKISRGFHRSYADRGMKIRIDSTYTLLFCCKNFGKYKHTHIQI